MRIHLQTLGCRLNEAELETWSRQFQERGHRITPDPAEADLLVVNTCAVTEEAVRKSRRLLRRAHRENPGARLVVSGCQASLDPSATREEPGVDLVVTNRDKDRLVEIASEALGLPTLPVAAIEPGADALWARGRQRAFVKVQDGCRYRCTFCVVTEARGDERSRPVAEVVTEINRLHADGIPEAVLAGVHLGGYGSDLGTDPGELVRAVLADTDMPRIRIGSLEPWDLPEGFWGLFENPRLMPHLHLPLQSGSDAVLRRMARRCKAGAFARLADDARAAVPDLNLTTDIIVGFPGEADADWRLTLELVERVGFGHLHLFPFSPRRGTRAALLPDPVDPVRVRARLREVQGLGERLRRDTLARFVGRRLAVLVEGREPEPGTRPERFGYTPNYLKVRLPGADVAPGERILEVDLTGIGADGECLTGRRATG